MKFAREAWPFVLPFAALAAILLGLGRPGWALGALLVALAVLLFFRDPKRVPAGGPGSVLSAADGLITRVDRVEDPAVGPGTFHRVVTFLSVFDVHVQKTPVAGRVVASSHARGRKLAAFRERAGEVNEQHLTVLERPDGDRIGVRQIAGLLARRVVCSLDEGDAVERAQPMGLIKFGSRVDVLVPEGYRVTVARGDRVKNGQTVIARPAGADDRDDEDGKPDKAGGAP
jgi:phosphatidylserine decarboxylase